jgi:lipopolysaccharide/colanic/teichoic acid biosynthesis glycosyltransferase/glycosyltransferase involved in cell wall biosynthesis
MNQKRLQPVRVLFIDHVVEMSGAEQSLADLVAGLSELPVEPVVILPADGPLAARLRAAGVLVRMVPMDKRLLGATRLKLSKNPLGALSYAAAFLAASFRIYRMMREVRPHIVHTNTLKTHLLASLPCAVTRTPLVWHLRDILEKGWLSKALAVCSRFASVVIVPSRAVAEPFKGAKTVFRKMRLIPNGIRVEDFQDASADRSLRQMMGAQPNDVVVGIVGRIAPWKGQETFIRAAAMLAQRHPRARFAIAGAPLFEADRAFEQHLHRMVFEAGLDERVTFLGWQPAPEAMAAIDVFVHASAQPEPFGRAIVEAMAAGKPIVASNTGAVPELVPPAAGILIPPARPELLADALDRVLSDRKMRKRMGEAGAAIADSFFPVARTVQSVAQLYRHLAAVSMRKAARRKRKSVWAKLPHRAPKPEAPEQPMSWPAQQMPQTPQAPAPRPAPKTHSRARTPRAGRLAPQAFDDRANGNGNGAHLNGNGGFAPSERNGFSPDHGNGNGNGSWSVPVDSPPPSRRGQSATARAAVLAAEMTIARPRTQVARQRVATAVATAAATMPVPAPAPIVAPARPTLVPDVFRPKPLYDAMKRFLDLALAFAITLFGAPVWIFVAVMIKLESRGPVFFKATAVGKDCKPYTYYKFRSMRTDGDDKAHRKFIERYVRENGGLEHEGEIIYKFKGDDRVTEVGRWIRKFSIDEIPQIINVIKGDMSFVGPRPPLDYEYEHYDERSKIRLAVLPGITGMQQVWSRDQASFEKKLELDMRYIARRSVWLDLKLIAHTILAIPRGH